MVAAREFLAEPAPLPYVDLEGRFQRLDLEPGTLGYTLCQVPVVLHRTGPAGIRVTGRDGSVRLEPGLELDPESSAEVFGRTGSVQRLDVLLGG